MNRPRIIFSTGNVPSKERCVIRFHAWLRMDFKPSVQPDGPYKGGTFYFKLALPEDFPFKAPTVWHISWNDVTKC